MVEPRLAHAMGINMAYNYTCVGRLGIIIRIRIQCNDAQLDFFAVPASYVGKRRHVVVGSWGSELQVVPWTSWVACLAALRPQLVFMASHIPTCEEDVHRHNCVYHIREL